MLTFLHKYIKIFRVTFHATKHFYQRLDERDLSFQDCKDVVNYPTSTALQRGDCPHGGKRKVFKKTLSKGTLVVVAEIKRNEAWLLTAYYEN